jgi:hypothetical protein
MGPAVRRGLAPSAQKAICGHNGWTKAQPYGGGHDAGSEASSTYSLRHPLSANIAAGPRPSRTQGVMMLGAKRAVLAPLD